MATSQTSLQRAWCSWAFLGALLLHSASEASQLAFITPVPQGGVGTTLGQVVVQRQDPSSNPIAPGSPLPIELTTTSPAGQFSTAGPEWWRTWSSTASISIPAGASNTPAVYYRDGAAGQATLTAAAAGFSSATQQVQAEPLTLSAGFDQGGVLDTDLPPGPFNHVNLYGTANAFTSEPSAAHRGAQGLRFTDSNTTGALTGEGHVALVMAPLSTPEFHVRMWIRWQHASAAHTVLSATMLSGTSKSALDFAVVPATGLVELAGHDATLAYRRVTGSVVSAGDWT